jgi:hypothetical protein
VGVEESPEGRRWRGGWNGEAAAAAAAAVRAVIVVVKGTLGICP